MRYFQCGDAIFPFENKGHSEGYFFNEIIGEKESIRKKDPFNRVLAYPHLRTKIKFYQNSTAFQTLHRAVYIEKIQIPNSLLFLYLMHFKSFDSSITN